MKWKLHHVHLLSLCETCDDLIHSVLFLASGLSLQVIYIWSGFSISAAVQLQNPGTNYDQNVPTNIPIFCMPGVFSESSSVVDVLLQLIGRRTSLP